MKGKNGLPKYKNPPPPPLIKEGHHLTMKSKRNLKVGKLSKFGVFLCAPCTMIKSAISLQMEFEKKVVETMAMTGCTQAEAKQKVIDENTGKH